MAKKTFQLTKEGVSELEQEKAVLIQQRPEVAEKIKAAREFGDLSENAEYQSAREEQQRNEDRINEIDNILQNTEIIARPKNDDRVSLGSTVELQSAKGTKRLQVVGTVEANPMEGKISDESPIGKALIGKTVGGTVVITTPSGQETYKIKAIN